MKTLSKLLSTLLSISIVAAAVGTYSVSAVSERIDNSLSVNAIQKESIINNSDIEQTIISEISSYNSMMDNCSILNYVNEEHFNATTLPRSINLPLIVSIGHLIR